VIAFIYRRARPIPKADFEEYVAKLKAAHPTRTRLSEPPPGLERYLEWTK